MSVIWSKGSALVSSALRGATRTTRDRWVFGIGAAAVAAALVAGGILLYRAANHGKQITAYFAESIGVYPGSTVRVLGVPVGTVSSVQPEGTRVKVIMTLNNGVAIPAGADAVVIAPSVVADRYIQLTPAYTSGSQIGDGAVIPVTRTAVPVEVDRVYASLAKLANALGPNGANKNGALSDLIKTGAANLSGNGTYLRQMITEFGGLSKTLGDSSGNLFATIAYLQHFTTMLKNNDGQVRLAENQLAQVSAFLASDRQDLSAAISQLAIALNRVKGFIGGNRALIESNVSKLAAITSLLVRERASLAEALDAAPLAADNLVGAYSAASHTLVSRGYLGELIRGNAPAGATGATGTFTTADTQPAGQIAPLGSVAVPQSLTASLPPLPLPSVGTVYGTPQALLAGQPRGRP
jgi:phospholipid/cholesterol/gamma-HCH transport system substrate-binding protein